MRIQPDERARALWGVEPLAHGHVDDCWLDFEGTDVPAAIAAAERSEGDNQNANP